LKKKKKNKDEDVKGTQSTINFYKGKKKKKNNDKCLGSLSSSTSEEKRLKVNDELGSLSSSFGFLCFFLEL